MLNAFINTAKIGSAYKTLYKYWNTIFVRQFLTSKDLIDGTSEDWEQQIASRWTHFCSEDLPRVMDAVRLAFPELASEPPAAENVAG